MNTVRDAATEGVHLVAINIVVRPSTRKRAGMYLWRYSNFDVHTPEGRKVHRAVAKQVIAALGLDPKGLRWDSYFGCSTCACSGAFHMVGLTGFEVHADMVEVGSERHIEAECVANARLHAVQ